MIRGMVRTVFDVGSSDDSVFTDFMCDVHYFDPDPSRIQTLSAKRTKNITSSFNAFGLGEENTELYYYPMYFSFFDRVKSCSVSDDANKVALPIRSAKEYVLQNNVESIDFLKIDTEGYELSVLKGFDETIRRVKFIQFEYGGTYIDSGVKLIEVVEYLKSFGFGRFARLGIKGPENLTDFSDNYTYCNIVCIRDDVEFVR